MIQKNVIFTDIDALRLLEKALDNDEQYAGNILNECDSDTDSAGGFFDTQVLISQVLISN